MQQTPPWYVLTGGPCAGKTTTLNELMRQGHPVLAEAARLEIDTKMAAGMAIEQIVSDPDWPYSVVRRSYAQENQMPTNEQWFLDRSTVDSLAYFKKFGSKKNIMQLVRNDRVEGGALDHLVATKP